MGKSSKNNDFCFSHTDSGEVGTMICATCKTMIEDGKYLSYKKWSGFDYVYVTHHLSCALLNDHFAIKYAEHVKKIALQKVEIEKKMAKRKKEAIKEINLSEYIEIECGENYDCHKVIFIFK